MLCIGAIAMICAITTPACATTPAPKRNEKLAHTHALLGADYLRKKMPMAAKQELVTALDLDPENPEAHELLGVLNFHEGLQKLNLLDRDQCLKGRAASEQIALANMDFRLAEDHTKKFVNLSEKENKTESNALVYLANIAIHFKRYDEAIALSTRALNNIVFAQRHLALAARGWAYLLKGKKEAAEGDFRQSIYHEPRFCLGRYRLGKAFFEEKDYKQAIDELTKVAEDPNCPIQEASHLLGLSYVRVREIEKAKVEFEHCVKQNPKSCLSEQCERLAKDSSHARSPGVCTPQVDMTSNGCAVSTASTLGTVQNARTTRLR
jgi:Tfp pilus assembly protein PilF